MAAPKGNEYYRNRIRTGAPRKFKTPEDLAAAFNDYFEDVEANPLKESVLMKFKEGLSETVKVFKRPLPRAMTLQGFCAFTGLSMVTLYEYDKQEGYTNIIAQAREIMYGQKLEGAAAGLFNASIIARELGLTEKSEQKIIQEQPLFDDSDEGPDA
jgi:hypothetical protein